MITRIELERILDFYDVPQLFIGKDILGTRYLCLLYDDERCYTYISIRTSMDRLRLFLGGKCDLRTLFVTPEAKNEYFIATYDDNSYQMELFDKETLPDKMLPDEGYFFEGENEDSSILCEAIEWGHPVIHLGFEDSTNSHSIPINTLSALTTNYQSLVANCYKKIDGTKGDTDYMLRVFATSAASFNIHLYAESNLDLFGSSRINKTLLTIDSLLKCTNSEELKEFLIPLKGHTIRSYKNFMKELIDNNLIFKYRWVSSIVESKVVSNRVELNQIEQIYEVLNESSELDKEIKLFEGILTACSITNGRWSLKTELGEEITGKSENPDLLSGVVLGEVKYILICEEILEQNNISSKEKVSLVLTKIERAQKEG